MANRLIFPTEYGTKFTAGQIKATTQGDTQPYVFHCFMANGEALDLSGHTVTVFFGAYQAVGTVAVDATVTNKLTWTPDADDVSTAGSFALLVKAVDTDGTIRVSDAVTWVVAADATYAGGGTPSAALEGVTAAQKTWIGDALASVPDAADLIPDAPADGTQYGRQDGDWAAISAVSDVGDLTTAGLTAANMLRVAAAGGLEERTPAQVLVDIGAEAAGSAAAAIAASVSKAGDTMTGALVLPGPPTIDLHAATKKYVDDNSGGGYGTNVMIVNGAGGGDYTTISGALAAITTASASNKFLIVVIGAVAETAAITAKPYVDVVFQSGAVVTITINGIANSYGVSFLGVSNCTWVGIGSSPHIIRAGSGTGAQHGLRVQSNDSTLVLYGLVVRNDAIYTTIGAAIYCSSTTAKLIKVTAIGSTAGNDAYGIQLVSASPEMRECIGIGGSNGSSCHGILTGTVSNAIMIRCIGYGGNGGISSRGINNAYGSNITMVECIGVGGDYSGGSGLFVNNTTSLRAIRCIGIGGGVLPKNGTATVTASSRQDDSFRAHATLPYRITGLSITVSAAAASGVTLTFRTATAGGGNAITGAVAVDTTGAKYIPVSGNYVISSAAYVYGRLSAVDATLAYTIAYTYELCSNASYGIYHDSDAQVIYDDCTAISNADSEGIYIGGNNGLTKFIGGTARSGKNDGTRRKAISCLALWNPGQVYDMVLDGGSANLVAAAGTANGSNIEL